MIRILIADDHQIMRQGLRVLLDRQPDMQVVAEAADGREAIACVRSANPDVAVIDIAMPELNGIDAIRQISAEHGGSVRVVVLSMHADAGIVQNTLAAGARGYILKESAYEDLIGAIHRVMGGHTCLSQTAADLDVCPLSRRISTCRTLPSCVTMIGHY